MSDTYTIKSIAVTLDPGHAECIGRPLAEMVPELEADIEATYPGADITVTSTDVWHAGGVEVEATGPCWHRDREDALATVDIMIADLVRD